MDTRPIAYDQRPAGPHHAAEALCPACGNLLAVGWRPEELDAVFGPVLLCTLCGELCRVAARAAGGR